MMYSDIFNWYKKEKAISPTFFGHTTKQKSMNNRFRH